MELAIEIAMLFLRHDGLECKIDGDRDDDNENDGS